MRLWKRSVRRHSFCFSWKMNWWGWLDGRWKTWSPALQTCILTRKHLRIRHYRSCLQRWKRHPATCNVKHRWSSRRWNWLDSIQFGNILATKDVLLIPWVFRHGPTPPWNPCPKARLSSSNSSAQTGFYDRYEKTSEVSPIVGASEV